jgi:hypothetical protein
MSGVRIPHRAPTNSERTIILYHGNCPDGFGGAYAAWKKFGDSVEYRPLLHGKPAPTDLANAKLYFVDFCYEQEVMNKIVAEAASVTVLDHHEGTRAVVESMPEFIFDNDRSGATIAWTYFHPEETVPMLLKYVEDGDLYRFVLPESRTLLSYLYAHPFTFESWDALRAELDDSQGFAHALEIGRIYTEHYNILLEQIVSGAELVAFEGHTVYMVSCPRIFVSDAGNRLYRKHPPFAILPSVKVDGIRVSLRGNGTVDLMSIAQKYGGNGPKSAAAFFIPFGTTIPWTPIPKDIHENSSN